jgi:hypothetical protein
MTPLPAHLEDAEALVGVRGDRPGAGDLGEESHVVVELLHRRHLVLGPPARRGGRRDLAIRVSSRADVRDSPPSTELIPALHHRRPPPPSTWAESSLPPEKFNVITFLLLASAGQG